MAEPTLLSEVKRLGTRAALEADPRFAGIVENVFPLTGQLGNTRTRIKTLGQGSFGRVNLEEVNTGQIAAKYFTDPNNIEDNITELAVLKDLQGFPYVAQLIKANTRPAALAVNLVGPPVNVAPLEFPVALMGKAKTDLHDRSIITNWDDIDRIVTQVLKGIAVMHGQGIVHRDIKPANILLTSGKEVWISDFGRARYIDKNLPKTKEVYTGTYSTSAPELLMKDILHEKSITDYEKSDMWAVGVTLYKIMTGDYLFLGANGRNGILDWMYTRAGFPQPTDGETYRLYEEMRNRGLRTLSLPLARYVPVPTAYKDRILARTRFPPADPARLETFATVINSLLSYNPDNRPTALDALRTITGENFAVPARRSLIEQYVNATPLPAVVAPMYAMKSFELLEAAYSMYTKPELPFTVDRAMIYARAFLNKNIPFDTQHVFLVALCLADVFFDTTNRDTEFRYNEILDIITGGGPATVAQINKVDDCINLFMTSDIQFLGRTFFDDLIDAVPPMSFRQVQTLGLLNFICHQHSIFPMYEGHLDLLKQRILAFIANPVNIQSLNYFRMRYHIGSGQPGDPIKPRIRNFLNYIRTPIDAVVPVVAAPVLPPVPGGRRHMSRKKARKSKRKTRQRKH